MEGKGVDKDSGGIMEVEKVVKGLGWLKVRMGERVVGWGELEI